MFVIQRVLEHDGKLTLLDQNEIITPNPYFRLFATSNTVGLGDTTGLYHGVQQINQAQMDRWSLVATLNYLSHDAEAAIVLAKSPHYNTEKGRKTIGQMVTVRLPSGATRELKLVGVVSDQTPPDLTQAAAWLRKQAGADGRRIGLAGSSVGALSVIRAGPEVKAQAILSLSPAGVGVFPSGARESMKGAALRGRASTLVLASVGDKEAAENATALKDLPGVALHLYEGDAHGFAYFKERADLMAVFFGEYLTYHHAGKGYMMSTPKAPGTPKNVINEQTLAERTKTDKAEKTK